MKKSLFLAFVLCALALSVCVVSPLRADELPTFRVGEGFISLTNSTTGRDQFVITGSSDRGDLFIGDNRGYLEVFELRVVIPTNMWVGYFMLSSYYPYDLVEGTTAEAFRLYSSDEYPTTIRHGIFTVDSLERDCRGAVESIDVHFEQWVQIDLDHESYWSGRFSYCVTPEPTTASIAVLGGLVIVAYRRRK